MKKVPQVVFVLLMCLLSHSFAQINLHQFSAMSVRDWKYVAIRIDTVVVETQIAAGVARTAVTMVVTPGQYQDYTYVTSPSVCDDAGNCTSSSRVEWIGPKVNLDSLEINTHFLLPTDVVMSDMYLWVNGQKVRAAIQDRSLARGQYEEIVNRRRDPCLVEFWGDGNYNMVIYPAKSGLSRKVQLVFSNTFDDDSAGLITASLPFVFDTANAQYYFISPDKSPIGFMKATITARDGNTYQFTMPGLGGGTVTAAGLTLERENLFDLDAGVISRSDPSSGNEYFWSGEDKDGNKTVGFSVMLAESTVQLAPEPQTRIIVIDVRNQWWDTDEYYNAMNTYYYGSDNSYGPYPEQPSVNVWARAQKLAVACLQNYVNQSQKFNVIIAGSDVRKVFNEPVNGTVENLLSAGRAVALASPSAQASTLDAVNTAVAQAGQGVVILITDLTRPYNYSRMVRDANGVYQQDQISADGIAFDTLLAKLSSAIVNSGVTLFTIDDEWSLWNIAHNSGGFRLAMLRDTYYYRYLTEQYAVDGLTRYRPVLPKLFVDNPYNGGISSVKVTSNDATKIVHTLDGNGYYWWGFNEIALVDALARKGAGMAKAERMIVPHYTSSRERLLRVAAIRDNTVSASMTYTVTGKMGGLSFTKIVSGNALLSSGLDSCLQWAFRTSEQLGQTGWYTSADSIKAIGKAYHIVTRQTSLLALEPGMELWEDTVSQSSNEKVVTGEQTDDLALPSDFRGASYNANGTDIDELSLSDMVEGLTATSYEHAVSDMRVFSAIARGNHIALTVPQQYENQAMTVQLFDIRGRLVASTLVRSTALTNGVFRWELDMKKGSLAATQYVLKVSAEQLEKTFRLPTVR